MRIDLPQCSFKLCRKCFDGNCRGSENDRIDCKEFRNGEWISVKEGLPKYNSNCFVTTENEDVFISKFYGYGEECQGFKEFPEGVWEINAYREDVVAWQPLPEKYKEIKNEN